MSTTGIGIVLGTLGSIAINTGNNLQSLGMAQLEAKIRPEPLSDREGELAEKGDDGAQSREEHEEIDACQSKTWVVGTTIFISGSLLNFSAFAFAPQSILASLEGIQFVTNVLFGKLMLGKEISNSMWAGTAVTIVGVVLTVLSASVVGTLEANFEDLIGLWGEVAWLVYLAITVTGGILLQVAHQAYVKASVDGRPLPYSVYVLPVTYATFSALFGTLSVVMAKVLSELVTLWIEGTPIFWGKYAWFTYVTLISWLALVGVWLYRMNEALSLYDPLFIIPLLQMNFILFAIISGGIYFKEFDEFRALNWIGFVFGVFMLFGGIYLLSPTGEAAEGLNSDSGTGCSEHPGPLQDFDAENGVRPFTPLQLPGNPQQMQPESHRDSVPGTPGSERSPTLRTKKSVSTPRQDMRPVTPGRTSPALPYYALIPPKMRTLPRDAADERTLFQSVLTSIADEQRVLSAMRTPKHSPWETPRARNGEIGPTGALGPSRPSLGDTETKDEDAAAAITNGGADGASIPPQRQHGLSPEQCQVLTTRLSNLAVDSPGLSRSESGADDEGKEGPPVPL